MCRLGRLGKVTKSRAGWWNRVAVLLWEEHGAWALLVCLPRTDGVVWLTAELWLVWDNLFCLQACRSPKCFSWKALNWHFVCGGCFVVCFFFFLPALTVGKHSFSRRKLQGSRGPCDHRSSCTAQTQAQLCACFLQNLLSSSTGVWSCSSAAQECQYCSWACATLDCILYLRMLNANPEGCLCCWAKVLLCWVFTALKQMSCLFYSLIVMLQSETLQSSVNSYGEMGFYFLEEQITYILWYLESCGFGSWRPFSLILISNK